MRLDRLTFNNAVLRLAPVHVARGFAPSCYAELMNAATLGGPLPVWEGASDQTIFSDARVNHAFRAWHDATHVARGHGFTLDGEIATMRDQCAALRAAFPAAPQWAYDILRAEVQGQAEYFATHGTFPIDQITFTLNAAGLDV